MKLFVTVGQAGSAGYVRLDLADVADYLAGKGSGRPLRWEGAELHTAYYRGRRAFVIQYQIDGQHWLPFDLPLVERAKITARLEKLYRHFEPWRYRYVGQMSRGYRKALEVVKAGGKVKIRWNDDYQGLAELRREFIGALHRRINLKVAPVPDYRKLDPDYQLRLRRDSQRVRDMLTKMQHVSAFESTEARQRFSHLI